jgi:hypothetical protein
MKKAAGWSILLVIGLILIWAGIQGRVGSVIGALITPGSMVDT